MPISGQVAVTWNNRNRTTPTIVKQSAASQPLESGQTTTIRIYKGDGTTLLRTVTGLTGTSYDYTASTEVADAGALQAGSPALVFKIKSVRDGYESVDVVKTLDR